MLDEAPVADDAAVLVPAARLSADAGRAVAAPRRTYGVIWPNNRNVAELAPYLDRLDVVALMFPKFQDGRAYSQARLCASVTASAASFAPPGEVLRDQFLFLIRAGFDAFEVTKPADAEHFAEATRRYSAFYQPAGDGADRRCAGRMAEAAAGRIGLGCGSCFDARRWLYSPRRGANYQKPTANCAARKPRIQRGADDRDASQHDEISVLPFELRHVLEVHSVDSSDSGRHRQNGGPGRELPCNFGLRHLARHQAGLECKCQDLAQGVDFLCTFECDR